MCETPAVEELAREQDPTAVSCSAMARQLEGDNPPLLTVVRGTWRPEWKGCGSREQALGRVIDGPARHARCCIVGLFDYVEYEDNPPPCDLVPPPEVTERLTP